MIHRDVNDSRDPKTARRELEPPGGMMTKVDQPSGHIRGGRGESRSPPDISKQISFANQTFTSTPEPFRINTGMVSSGAAAVTIWPPTYSLPVWDSIQVSPSGR